MTTTLLPILDDAPASLYAGLPADAPTTVCGAAIGQGLVRLLREQAKQLGAHTLAGDADRGVLVDDAIRDALAGDPATGRLPAIVAGSTSSGKDSHAALSATWEYLDRIGHPRDRRVLIHSDLGTIEHAESHAHAAAFAARLGAELLVVRREAGDMLAQWQQRWESNVRRYAALRVVGLIKPWSDSGMRFCTEAQKTSPIGQALVRRFPGQTIISVLGLRRQESEGRKNTPCSKTDDELTKVLAETSGFTWCPIAHWTVADVLAHHAARAIPLHPGYLAVDDAGRCRGLSRISCSACVLAQRDDLRIAAEDPRNWPAFATIARLELASTFSFQPGSKRFSGWVADLCLAVGMPRAQRGFTTADVTAAKAKAARRQAIEARLPEHLRFTKQGWPKLIPNADECALIAEVRREVAALAGLDVTCTTPETVRAQYETLFAEARRRETVKQGKADRKASRARHQATVTTQRAAQAELALV